MLDSEARSINLAAMAGGAQLVEGAYLTFVATQANVSIMRLV